MNRIAVLVVSIAFLAPFSAYSQPPTRAEMESWNKFVKEKNLKSIDIPFAFTTTAVTVAGTVHLRDPFDSSSVEAIAAGAIVGKCELDKNRSDCRMYDPSGQLLRMVMEMNFAGKELRSRVDTRRWDGGWSEGSWLVVWRQ